MVESEVEEASQVDGRGSDGEGLAVAFNASVADSAVAVGDEPRNGSFDHRSVLPVVVDAVTATPLGSRCGEVLVVFADFERLAVDGGGASCADRAAVAAWPEAGRSGAAVVTVCPLGQLTVRPA